MPDVKPKYLFPHVGEIVLSASDALFGFNEAKDKKNIFLVEGVFDVIALTRKLNDFDAGVISILNKHMSVIQKNKLLKLKKSNFFIMLDSDASIDSLKIGEELSKWGIKTKICFLESGDPDSCTDKDLFNSFSQRRHPPAGVG